MPKGKAMLSGPESQIPRDRPSKKAVASSSKKTIEEIVAGLKELNSPDAELNKPVNENFEAALLEEASREIVLWAVLKPFLRDRLEAILEKDELEEALEHVLDQSNFLLTPQLIKQHLRQQGPLNLSRFAEYRHKRGSASWHKFQLTLTRELFPKAQALELWNVVTLHRKEHSNGGGDVRGYEISAGRTLIEFNRYIYQPKNRELKIRFYEKHYKNLK